MARAAGERNCITLANGPFSIKKACKRASQLVEDEAWMVSVVLEHLR